MTTMLKKLSLLTAPLLFATLGACATTSPEPVPLEQEAAMPEPEAVPPLIAAPAEKPAAPVTPPPEPVKVTTSSFIGKPASALEAVVGAPAFKRAELAGEFRRYDLGPCRVYAVIAPDTGGRPVIGSLSISGQSPGQSVMTLDQCIKAG